MAATKKERELSLLRVWIDYGNKIVLVRVGRLDILTWWKRSKR